VADQSNGTITEAGVVTIHEDADELSEFGRAFAEALAAHRHHSRALTAVPA
jgi:hypothetical protein